MPTAESTQEKFVKCAVCVKTAPKHERLVKNAECWYRKLLQRIGSGCTSGKTETK